VADPLNSTSTRLLNAHVLGGSIVAVMALVAWTSAQGLDFGTLAEIGPGLFPVALAVILLVLSLCLVGFGVFKRTETFDVPNATAWRSLLAILAALVAFALTIKGTGFTPALGVTGATPLAILTAGFASSETRWRDLLLFAIVLTAFCAGLFRFLLGLPLPLAPWLLGY
jgi:Tripartite tricarboxylate transporter TctB family